MFWGISLEVGKRYSQTVEKSFHISMAALNASNAVKGSVTVMVEVEKACYPLCTLHTDRIPQQALDYVFTEGEEVLFYTEGNIDVHLTGYLIDDPNPVEYSSDEEEGSAADSNESVCGNENSEKKETRKRKSTRKSTRKSNEEENLESLISELDDLNEDNQGNVDLWLPRSARKKHKSDECVKGSETQVNLTEKLLDNDSDGSEQDDHDWQPGMRRKLSKKKGRGEAEESGSKEKKADNSSSFVDSKNRTNKSKGLKCDSPNRLVLSPNSSKSKKKPFNEKEVNSYDRQHDNVGSEDAPVDRNCSQEEKSLLFEETKNKKELSNTEEKSHDKKELPGGIIIEDLVKGRGRKAKKGKEVTLNYKGILKKSKKQFDASSDGKPYTFRLGKGEAIYKGWDAGLEGMHVGGRRRLIIPPSLGYGSNETGPNISPNSTLVFEVELLKVQ